MVKLRAALRPGLIAASYLALACLVYWPVSPFARHTIVDCTCQDPVQEVWFLHWSSWAVLHGHNPFYTRYLHAPSGANLALNTSFPLLGILGTPITALGGPLMTYNLFLRLAVASSALSMYWVLRRYCTWRPAAYAGGLLYGFSAYEIGHAHRHLFLTFIPLLPLFVPLVDVWLVRMSRRAVGCGALLGLLLAAQFLISAELVVFIVAGVIVGLLVLALTHRREVRPRVRPLLLGALPAVGTFALIAGYPMYLMLFGPQRPVGALHPLKTLYPYHSDLLGPVLPTRGEVLFTTDAGNRLVNASVTENGSYFGLPLLLLLVALAWRYRRIPLVRASVVVAILAFVFSLGTVLTVDNGRIATWMPFRLIDRIPIIQQMEPARLSLMVVLPASFILAIGLDRWRADGWRPHAAQQEQNRQGKRYWRRPVLVLTVSVASLLPLLPRIPLQTAPVNLPAFFTTKAVDTIPAGALVMTYPYSMTPLDLPMLWQSASDMRFRMFGGQAFVPGANGVSTWNPSPPKPPDIDALLLANRPPHKPLPSTVPGLAARVSAFLRAYHVDVILVDPRASRANDVTRVITDALGGTAPQRLAGMNIWLDVPADVSALTPR